MVLSRDFGTQKNFQVFVENHGLTPLEKWTFSCYVKMKYCCLKGLFSHLEHYSISCVGLFQRKWHWEEFQIFEEGQGLTTLEKWTFSPYFKMTLLWSRKSFFPFRTLFNIISRSFLKDNEMQKNFQIFVENHGFAPLQKRTFSVQVYGSINCC